MKKKNRIWIYAFIVMGIALMLTSSCSKDNSDKNLSNKVTDVDGNVYDTITIGTQVWMVENLKTTKYNDGSSIPLVTDATEWSNLSTAGYCWYNNDSATYKNIDGALYNWYAVNSGKLCPIGWHVPSDVEWTMLTTFLGGDSIACGKLKEVGTTNWESPNAGANNVSGFGALPSGYHNFGGLFYDIKKAAYWWSTAEYNTTNAWCRYLSSNSNTVNRYGYSKKNGFSVRCVRD